MPKTKSYIHTQFSIKSWVKNTAIVDANGWGMDDSNLEIFTKLLSRKLKNVCYKTIKELSINLSGNHFSSNGLQLFLDNFLINTSLKIDLDLSNKSIDALDRLATEKILNILQSPALSKLCLDHNVVEELQRLYKEMKEVDLLAKITYAYEMQLKVY